MGTSVSLVWINEKWQDQERLQVCVWTGGILTWLSRWRNARRPSREAQEHREHCCFTSRTGFHCNRLGRSLRRDQTCGNVSFFQQVTITYKCHSRRCELTENQNVHHNNLSNGSLRCRSVQRRFLKFTFFARGWRKSVTFEVVDYCPVALPINGALVRCLHQRVFHTA